MTEDATPRTPPRVAVALHYEQGADAAPRVVAKGRGAIADEIIARAEAHDVAIEENPVLAQALAQVDLDDQIPPELYRAVAEVIGFVLHAAARR